MFRRTLAGLLIILCAPLAVSLHAAADEPIRAELDRLAADYRIDPSRLDVVFGLRVDGRDWTVASSASGVTVRDGAPDTAAMVFVTDGGTFARIAAGDLAGLTSMAQARSSDPTPMTLDVVHDLEFNDETLETFMSVLFHFFTTGQPEIIPLGSAHARVVHGGNALPIYYAPHLRTSWYAIAPGQHINEDPIDQVNDFASIFIMIKAGSAKARLGGAETPLRDNTAIFVPPGMTHEFWNDGEEDAQIILLMFGENA